MRDNRVVVRLGLLYIGFSILGSLCSFGYATQGLLAGIIWLSIILLKVALLGTIRLEVRPSEFTVLVFLDLGLYLYPSLRLAVGYERLLLEQYVYLGVVGLVAGVALFLTSQVFRRVGKEVKLDHHVGFSDGKLIGAFLLVICAGFFASIISYYLGISLLGREASVQLPYKLNGILLYYRKFSVSFLCILILALIFAKQRKFSWLLLFFYFVWVVVEIYVKQSKGWIFVASLPLLYFALSNGFLRWRHVIGLTVCLAGYISVYPLLVVIRDASIAGYSLIDSGQYVLSHRFRTMGIGDYFFHFYSRVFGDSSKLLNIQYAFDATYFFNNFAVVNLYKNPAYFYTRYILEVPLGVVFSAGSTGVFGGMIVFGLLGVAGTVSLVGLFAAWIDRKFVRSSHRLDIFSPALSSFVFLFMMQGFWQWIFDRETVFVIIFHVVIILYLNSKLRVIR